MRRPLSHFRGSRPQTAAYKTLSVDFWKTSASIEFAFVFGISRKPHASIPRAILGEVSTSTSTSTRFLVTFGSIAHGAKVIVGANILDSRYHFKVSQPAAKHMSNPCLTFGGVSTTSGT
jgi:hypothetical protein